MHPFTPDEWTQQTLTQMRTYLIQHLPDHHGPAPVLSGPISSTRPTGYSTAAKELIGFKRGIKREIAGYPSIKEERIFDGFKRSLLIVARSHKCNEVLDPTYNPGNEPEQMELFETKQTFMFSVFNASFQTDMGKTIVRRHLTTTDAKSVWRELSEHMRTSSKGVSENRRLTQYVTNTVLDDSFKGTSEQFVLHFKEQFRQLDEISDDSEKLPPSVKLTLLQTAVRSINDLRIVETLDKFQSTTHGHGSSTSLSYQTFYDLLVNACVRYDKMTKANIGKRRNVYNSTIDNPYVDSTPDVFGFVPDSPNGGIGLPPDEFYQIHALSSRHPPPPRPGNPPKPPFRPHSQQSGPQKVFKRYDGPIYLAPNIFKLLSQDAMKLCRPITLRPSIDFTRGRSTALKLWKSFRMRSAESSVPDTGLLGPSDLPDSDLTISDHPILNYVNSQCHSSEDLDRALQAYEVYQIPCPQDSTHIAERTTNHHYTYHVAQASQAKHGSLGGKGSQWWSCWMIFSRSSRKHSVTGIESQELQGLDVVQCAASVETNHGIVN